MTIDKIKDAVCAYVNSQVDELTLEEKIEVYKALEKEVTSSILICEEKMNGQNHYDPHNDRFNETFHHIMNATRIKRCIDLNNKIQKTCGDIISMIYHIFHILSYANIYVVNDTALNVVENAASTIISGDFTTEDHKWMINVKFIVTMDTCDYDGYIYFRLKDMYGGAYNQLCNSINVRMCDDHFEYTNIVTEFAKKLSHIDDEDIKCSIKQICRVCNKFIKYLEEK